MTCARCRWSTMSSTMALRLLTVSMHKFLIWSFWAFCCCLAPKTASQYAPKTDSTRPTITPQKNSLLRTVTIHMGVNPDNRPHPHTWGFNYPWRNPKEQGGWDFSLPVKDARAFKFRGLLI